jgi:large subunit ribosomal protein L23
MKGVYRTVRQPLITEKSTVLREATGVYCFRADVRANKIEIAKAVEALFGVKVAEVRTARVRGKRRRVGRYSGKRPDWKKAWVRLVPGEKAIELFESGS